jgi:hypothetical protein
MSFDQQDLEKELDDFLNSRESNQSAPAPTEPPTDNSANGAAILRQVIHKVVADKPEEAAVDFKQYLKTRLASMW